VRASFAALLVTACVPSGPLRSGGTSGPDLLVAGANVPLRSDGTPAPEHCPQDALAVMQALELRPVHSSALVELDANQIEREPLTVLAGPIESVMMRPMGQLGAATRLYGRAWTSGPRVVIRYYYAQRDRENPLPICAVARLMGGELEGKPGKFPNSTELEYSRALAFVVRDFL
jgi:hypothetical protein